MPDRRRRRHRRFSSISLSLWKVISLLFRRKQKWKAWAAAASLVHGRLINGAFFFFFPFKPVFLPKSFRRLMMLCDNHFKLASFCQISASVSLEVMGEPENFDTTTLWSSFVVFRCLILVRVARGIHWVRAGYTLVTGLFTLTFTPSVNLEWTMMLLLHATHARLPERQDQSSKEI